MTREEAFKRLEQMYDFYAHAMDANKNYSLKGDAEAIKVALLVMAQDRSAHITREQVEKVWAVRTWETVADEGFVDTMGRQVFHLHCPVCDFFWRETGHKKYFRFCPHCGAPMTAEAVDILWKRLEAMRDGAKTD